VTTWVVDTSSLIFPAKLDRLNLLHTSADAIYVPQAVLDKVHAGRDEAVQSHRALDTTTN